MGSTISTNLRFRKIYGSERKTIDPPDLIRVQKESYNNFLQRNVAADKRTESGLQGVFRSVFPIKGMNDLVALDFEWYKFEDPKYEMEECRQRGMTFQSPVRVKVCLTVYELDEETGVRSVRDMKEQEVYFGDMPLMTDTGTFVVNGVERVVVNQLHRSPGAFFKAVKGKKTGIGKLLYAAQLIPYRGSWLDFQFDQKDYIWVLVDRNRSKKAKVYASTFLKALGYSVQELLDYFYKRETIRRDKVGEYYRKLDFDLLKETFTTSDIKDPESGKTLLRKGTRLSDKNLKKLEKQSIFEVKIPFDEVTRKVFAEDIIDEGTGEVLCEANQIVEKSHLEEFKARGIEQFDVLFFDERNVGPFFRNTLAADKTETQEEAVMEIYKKLRPGDPATPIQARKYFEGLFFGKARYDLSPVGRLKLNSRFGLDEPMDVTVLTRKDILEVVRYLVELRNSRGDVDDIDHLGNRRVRSVGESLENKYRVGLVRMERSIKERMKSQSAELDKLMPHDLINSKPVIAAVNEFFGSGELSQFMDQTNPLSEMTHKRRLSALGPGGLTRERAGFEVRDVHNTHYGRICPIETPEGPNIGLISSLSTYAKVNDYGFIETPYRKVTAGVVGRDSRDVTFLSATDEGKFTIAQAGARTDGSGKLLDPLISARKKGEFVTVKPEEVEFMDVSSTQLVSVAAALVPFLEHDDANRALMGANMQRQAVPLLKGEAPIVGTGMEEIVARNSGVTIVSQNEGLVESVDASRIVVRREGKGSNLIPKPDIYSLMKYTRSNQNTCINQRPLVRKGDRIRKGEIIADGSATDGGELALGKNVLVAFMPWGGYNFEDAILVSERLVHEDVFTSVHIFEYECVARETKLGKEEITRDIPNVSEEALRNLDESGIVRIGAEVGPGDILVGKITPKGETMLSPEEKLLRAIFGEKAGDVRDTSLKVPTGVWGTVIGAKVFARKGVEKDTRSRGLEEADRKKLLKDRDDELKIIQDAGSRRAREVLLGNVTSAKVVSDSGKTLVAKGTALTEEVLQRIPGHLLSKVALAETEAEEALSRLNESIEEQLHACKTLFDQRLDRLGKGEDLPPGIIKIVKTYVAVKRRLSVGDKMAGRHGNKGVISKILPIEDMPYLANGQAVDLVLNPLGVPSRMNVGQILEVHLGWAAYNIGRQIAELWESQYGEKAARKALKQYYDTPAARKLIDTMSEEDLLAVLRDIRKGIRVESPVFDGVKEAEIKELLKTADVSQRGQEILFDGRTGDPFAQDVTVGIMYMMKLHHLVDDKVHARSTGPYSLVTQQPLGGKAQFGGQRLGEMEVWAIEAYGAAYTLQEFLTVKSDDVVGRTRMYEAIVKGENVLEAGIPESFNVLMKEIKSLGIDFQLIEGSREEKAQ
jgi:DNA-directed RNA polymerase subunit beta